MTQEPTEKRNRAKALILERERQLKLMALDFGMQFARNRRQHIKTLIGQLQESLTQDDEIRINQYYVDLQLKLNELDRQIRQYRNRDI